MHGTVPRRELRTFGAYEPPKGVGQRLGRQDGVEPRQCVAQARLQHDLRVLRALGSKISGRDSEAMFDGPAEAPQPFEGGVFDYGFGEGGQVILSTIAALSFW